MRCLALADELRDDGARTHFISRESTRPLAEVIGRRGHEILWLPNESEAIGWNRSKSDDPAHASWLPVPWLIDAHQTLTHLRSLDQIDWLIVDHYALDFRWENLMRGTVDHLMAIDDLADRRHDCDVLLDQNLQSCEDRYRSLISPQCLRLLGPRFALLHRDFGAAPKHRTKDAVERILVFVGSADPDNVTGMALDALNIAGLDSVAVDVALGSVAPHLESIRRRCLAKPNWTLHVDTTNMAELVARADLTLGSAGGASWERCCLGAPALLVCIARNQRMNALELARRRAALFLGESDALTAARMADVLSRLVRRPKLLERISERAKTLVDGLGIKRALSVLNGHYADRTTFLLAREAAVADVRFTFDIRNDPAVYTWFFTPHPVSWEEHDNWFRRRLSSPTCLFLIIEDEKAPAGVIRFDLNGAIAEVSLALHPRKRGKGLGTESLRLGLSWLARKAPHIAEIVAKVKPDNLASLKTFAHAGFSEVCRTYRFELTKLPEH